MAAKWIIPLFSTSLMIFVDLRILFASTNFGETNRKVNAMIIPVPT